MRFDPVAEARKPQLQRSHEPRAQPKPSTPAVAVAAVPCTAGVGRRAALRRTVASADAGPEPLPTHTAFRGVPRARTGNRGAPGSLEQRYVRGHAHVCTREQSAGTCAQRRQRSTASCACPRDPARAVARVALRRHRNCQALRKPSAGVGIRTVITGEPCCRFNPQAQTHADAAKAV